jgi:hypothetical protein
VTPLVLLGRRVEPSGLNHSERHRAHQSRAMRNKYAMIPAVTQTIKIDMAIPPPMLTCWSCSVNDGLAQAMTLSAFII